MRYIKCLRRARLIGKRICIPKFDFVEHGQALKGDDDVSGGVTQLRRREARVVLIGDENSKLVSKFMCSIVDNECLQRNTRNCGPLCHLDVGV